MAKSIALAADASRLASLLLSYIPAVCAFVAPSQPGSSTAIIDRLSHSRALSTQRAPSRVSARAASSRTKGSASCPAAQVNTCNACSRAAAPISPNAHAA